MTDAWFETAFGDHYALVYAHRDEAEAARCLDLLPRLAPLVTPDCRMVLDLGCGDGRHLRRLRDDGQIAVGLDLSASLLAAARASAAVPLVRGDMRRLPLRNACCGSVLSLFTAFGYFEPRTANRTVVDEVARVLAPGGHWFLDLFDADRVRRELAADAPARRRREAGPLAVTEERRLDAGGGLVAKAVTLHALPGREAEAAAHGVGPAGLSYEERVAVFELDELDAMAAAAGLDRVAAAGSYIGAPLGDGPRWVLVYQKARTVGMAS